LGSKPQKSTFGELGTRIFRRQRELKARQQFSDQKKTLSEKKLNLPKRAGIPLFAQSEKKGFLLIIYKDVCSHNFSA